MGSIIQYYCDCCEKDKLRGELVRYYKDANHDGFASMEVCYECRMSLGNPSVAESSAFGKVMTRHIEFYNAGLLGKEC